MRSRGRELFDLLVELVKVSKGGLPLADRGKGGIILVGWSFGTTWMNALLANIASFHTDAEVNLERYVRRVVLYGMCIVPPPPSSVYKCSPPYLCRTSHMFNWAPSSTEPLQPVHRPVTRASWKRAALHGLAQRILHAWRSLSP